MFLHLCLVFEYFLTMLTEVNNFVVFLQHVSLQGFPLPALILTLLAFQPGREYLWFLQNSHDPVLWFVQGSLGTTSATSND